MVLEICSDRRSSRRSRSHNRDYLCGCQRRRPILAISPRQSLNAPESSLRSRRKAVTKKSNGRGGGGGGGGGGGKKSYRSSHRSRRHPRPPTQSRNQSPSTSQRSHLPDVGIYSSSTSSINPLESVSNASTDVSAKQRRSLFGVF
ncbi:unnamed protein product [Rodentolepis nana]|uniref:Uncharacterized protein n=1 Tax=Rodentolepis nana TaxID=102285 RepID=A0A0R3TU22_RODNA|nr:unnamed protein product [Rodentolepis nana]